MAFFKFRWPGQKQQEGKTGKAARPAKAESIDAMRRRARHRLMGAAVLIVLGVVGFPLLFDTQPRPIPVDTPIEIPDRNKVAPLVVPADAPSAAGAVLAQAGGSLDEGEEELVAPRPAPSKPSAAVPAPAPAPAFVPQTPSKPAEAVKAELKPETKSQAKPDPKPEAKSPSKPVPADPPAKPEPTKPSKSEISGGEAARARALLEGRSVPAVASPSPALPPDTAAQEGRFIVQVGAFADAAAAQEVKEKLERAGFKAFTQAVNTSEGKRTRVRVGPLQGRSEADKAALRIKGMGLAASVQKL